MVKMTNFMFCIFYLNMKQGSESLAVKTKTKAKAGLKEFLFSSMM